MAQMSYRAADLPPDDFTPIPDGWYQVQIDESETVQNKKQNGSFLKLTLVVVDGEYTNRRLFDRLNLDNPNPTAVKIAEQTLGKILKAIGLEAVVNDSSELHGIKMLANVKTKTGDDGVDRNEIKGYKPLAEAEAPAAEAQTPRKNPYGGKANPAKTAGAKAGAGFPK